MKTIQQLKNYQYRRNEWLKMVAIGRADTTAAGHRAYQRMVRAWNQLMSLPASVV